MSANVCVLHYKLRRWFLFNGAVPEVPPAGIRSGIHQWATGVKEFRGAEGTWRHATYVTAFLEYAEKRSSLRPCPECRRPMGIRRP